MLNTVLHHWGTILEAQLLQLFSGYSNSPCIIHRWVHVIMLCLHASIYSYCCHQQFPFLQSLFCFLNTNIASEFEFLFNCCCITPKVSPQKTIDASPRNSNSDAFFNNSGQAYQTFISTWFPVLHHLRGAHLGIFHTDERGLFWLVEQIGGR